jgi:hypothetical protein
MVCPPSYCRSATFNNAAGTTVALKLTFDSGEMGVECYVQRCVGLQFPANWFLVPLLFKVRIPLRGQA